MIEGRLRGVMGFRGAHFVLACLAYFAITALPCRGVAEEPVPPPRPSHNLYGITGLIDMPTAEMQPDAELSFTAGFFSGYLRNTLSAQILPWLEQRTERVELQGDVRAFVKARPCRRGQHEA